jgi:hypothetical protein
MISIIWLKQIFHNKKNSFIIISLLFFLFISVFLIWFFCWNNYNEFSKKFKSIPLFEAWLNTKGYNAKILGSVPDYSRGMYQAHSGAIIMVDEKKWHCYLFGDKKHWQNVEKNQNTIFKSFKKFLHKNDKLAKIRTFYNVKCFK